MAGRRQQAAFRPAAKPATTSAPSRRQAVAMIAALVVVASAIAIASFTVKPSKARSFDLFYGSMFIDDDTAPVSIDLASGKPTVRLPDAYLQVNAKQRGDLDVVPLAGGTLLLDTVTGEFNMVDGTGIVAKSGGGVPLGTASGTTTSLGLASGGSAYIVRTGTSGTSVYLISLSTVTSATGGGPVRPRASIGMTEPVTDPSTTTVAANSDLWLLAGSGNSRKIRQLSVPKGSNPGVSLTTADHGSVSGVAALGVSTAKADGSGGDVVAAASSGSIQMFDPTGGSQTVSVKAPSDVDKILPVTNEEGAFAFLYHSSSGWSVVRTAVGASGDAVVQPLNGIDGTANLAVPAQSSGALYTADRGNGALWQVGVDGHAEPVPDVAKYPTVAGETADYTSITVAARGARVIVNSRSKVETVTVFSDGSQKPVINRKDAAVDATANGAAAALSDLHHNPSKDPGKTPPKTHVDPAQQVTDKINCQTVKQVPHVPSVDLVDRGSRSVQLHWTYPILDRQDCYPSTYTVAVKLLSDNAPAVPHLPAIQGSDGVNIVGLFPDTQYSFIVTAYINGKGTPSLPLRVRTSIEGPAAPTNVRTSVDDQGNWIVSWNSCGGVQNSCVPAANWTVVPQLCDGAGGLVNAPANAHVVGDPTSHSFSFTYKGNGSLLGRGLNFQVAGIGLKGTTGNVSQRSSCAYSWAHPIPGNIHVVASTPPAVSGQDTSHTTVTVSFSGDKNVDLGGVGGQLTYQLQSGGSTVTTQGPTSDTSVSLDGIRPGQSYTVQVLVSPPRHPTASVPVPRATVQAAVANWPALTVSPTFDTSGSANGDLKVKIGGLTSATARGETFDLTNSGLDCGSTHMDLSGSNFDPASKVLTFPIARSEFNGGCRVTVQLVENDSTKRNPAYFGGNPSHAASGSVNIPVPTLDTSAAQFKANFIAGGGFSTPQIAAYYAGGNNLLGQYGTNWQLTAQYQGSDGTWNTCSGTSSDNPADGSPVTLNLFSCYYSNRSANWQVVVDFDYFGQSPSPAYAVAVNGTGPQPITLSKSDFDVAWAGDSSNPFVRIEYNGSSSDLNKLDWNETVTPENAQSPTCASSTDAPTTYLSVDDTTCPLTGDSSSGTPTAAPTYQVTVTWKDTVYGTTDTYVYVLPPWGS